MFTDSKLPKFWKLELPAIAFPLKTAALIRTSFLNTLLRDFRTSKAIMVESSNTHDDTTKTAPRLFL